MQTVGIDVNLYKPATLRHAAISMWIGMGESREVVAQRTGHRSLNIISFYYDKSLERDLTASLESRLWSSENPGDDEESEEEFDCEGDGESVL